jgi:Arc/MetJ-type ribon-helix-helix transcriptional regulator
MFNNQKAQAKTESSSEAILDQAFMKKKFEQFQTVRTRSSDDFLLAISLYVYGYTGISDKFSKSIIGKIQVAVSSNDLQGFMKSRDELVREARQKASEKRKRCCARPLEERRKIIFLKAQMVSKVKPAKILYFPR